MVMQHINNTDLDGLPGEHCELLLQIIPQENEVKWQPVFPVPPCFLWLAQAPWLICTSYQPFLPLKMSTNKPMTLEQKAEMAKKADSFADFGEAEQFLYQVVKS